MTPGQDVLMIAGTASGDILRTTMRELIAGAAHVAFAVDHVRLPALHAIADVLPGVERCRMALGRLDAHQLDTSVATEPGQRHALERLLAFARSGRLEIRSAGVIRWDPDVSLFRMRNPACGSICLFGAHYLAPPHADIDFPITCLLRHRAAVRRVERHYEALWDAGHDALGPVIETLERRLCA